VTAVPWLRRTADALELCVYVQPRASRDEFAGTHGDRLKIRLTAAPSDGKANAALLTFIAGAFGVPKSAVTLIAGHGSRHKRIAILHPQHIPPDVAAEANGTSAPHPPAKRRSHAPRTRSG
jgi:uncharacterized protein (TIGR00251 family)